MMPARRRRLSSLLFRQRDPTREPIFAHLLLEPIPGDPQQPGRCLDPPTRFLERRGDQLAIIGIERAFIVATSKLGGWRRRRWRWKFENGLCSGDSCFQFGKHKGAAFRHASVPNKKLSGLGKLDV